MKNNKIRLNRFLSLSGICSRRKADILIESGEVEVNGKIITDLGTKVNINDKVRYNDRIIVPEKKVYILLNKPKGFITSTSDERGRKTVMDLIDKSQNTKLFPVGRLDRNTTGVLLITNDGDLTMKLLHPRHKAKKGYIATLDKVISSNDINKIREGIKLKDGMVRVSKINHIEGKPKNIVNVEIHIGKNKVIKRLFKSIGYHVNKLDRVYFGGLKKKNLKRGQWRELDSKEVGYMKML